MEKDISNSSTKDRFLLVTNAIVDEKSKKLSKKQYAEKFDILGTEIFQLNKIPFSERLFFKSDKTRSGFVTCSRI